MSDAIAIRLGGQFGEFFGAGNLNLSKVDAILQNMLFGIFTGEKKLCLHYKTFHCCIFTKPTTSDATLY